MTISETAKKYDLTPDTLRYYERIGLIPPVRRNASGLRDYDQEACRWGNSSNACEAPACPSRC